MLSHIIVGFSAWEAQSSWNCNESVDSGGFLSWVDLELRFGLASVHNDTKGVFWCVQGAKVPLNEYEFPSNKIANVQSQLVCAISLILLR
jgi:hypothetical protein